MATVNSFSVFANSLVRPPVNPKTGLTATLDERTNNFKNDSSYDVNGTKDVDDREDEYQSSEHLLHSRPTGASGVNMPFAVAANDGDFYDRLTKMMEGHKKSLEVYEQLYLEKRSEYDDAQEASRVKFSSVDNLFDTSALDTIGLNGPLYGHDETVQRVFASRATGSTRGTSSAKPPSGKPKVFESLPAKSSANSAKAKSRAHREMTTDTGRFSRTRDDDRYWKVPLSASSSEIQLNAFERYREYLTSTNQNETSQQPIADVWERFSLANYDTHSGPRGRLVRSNSMSQLPTSRHETTSERGVERTDGWKNRVTVPEPFSMTLRDASRTPRKTKAMIEAEQKRAEKQLAEEIECQKKFKATPPPAHIYVPMFHEIVEEQESKKRYVQEHGYELLKSLQQPFEFSQRDAIPAEKKSLSKSVDGKISGNEFKANPFPSHIFDESIGGKKAEDKEYRRIRAKMRAKELMRSAKLPPSMEERGRDYYAAKSQQKELAKKAAKTGTKVDPTFRPKVNKSVPDFDENYRRFLASVKQKQKQTQKEATVCKPFKLSTSKAPPSKTQKLFENRSGWTMQENGSGRLLKSQRSRPFSRSFTGPLSTSLDSIPARMTQSAQLRANLVKLNREKSIERENEASREKQQKALKEIKLQQMVATRSAASDSSNHSKDRDEMLKMKLRTDKERSASYRKQLNEMKKRIQERPLLFEQIAEKNAKLAAERKYLATLGKSGIDVEYLSKKMTSDVGRTNSFHEEEADESSRSPTKDESRPASVLSESCPASVRSSQRSRSRTSSGHSSERSVTKSEDREYTQDFDGTGGSESSQSEASENEEK